MTAIKKAKLQIIDLMINKKTPKLFTQAIIKKISVLIVIR